MLTLVMYGARLVSAVPQKGITVICLQVMQMLQVCG